MAAQQSVPQSVQHYEHEKLLAPYALKWNDSKGRAFKQPDDPFRCGYTRDRDRIIHTASFRRLEYKTQVFINHEGDMFRTRLTHSIEVSQIARSIARNLKLNEVLVEGIALAHDLGHTPFGHAGQDALNLCMGPYGGFEHNLQSLRIVDELEKKYAQFDGLNLSYETREGILKHCSKRNALALGDIGLRFLNGLQPSLEAQLTNVADEIAYNNHDIDDGIRSGLISIEGLRQLHLFDQCYVEVMAQYPDIRKSRLIPEIIRNMIAKMVSDLTFHSRHMIQSQNIQSAQEVPFLKRSVVFSDDMYQQIIPLKQYLRKNLYQAQKVQAMSEHGQLVVKTLFEYFIERPLEIPQTFYGVNEPNSPIHQHDQARIVCDYIAGMTDRFAIKTFNDLKNA